jgi:hypothetical protein
MRVVGDVEHDRRMTGTDLEAPRQVDARERRPAAHEVSHQHLEIIACSELSAEARDQTRTEARAGLQRWNNEYIHGTLQRPGSKFYKTADDAVDDIAFTPGAATVIGTPDVVVSNHVGFPCIADCATWPCSSSTMRT